jgi:lipoprotein-releasing system ATP-binding protein
MLKADKVSKSYAGPSGPLEILSDVDFELDTGEAAVVMGPSGSGKSTFLYILGALDRPTSGSVSLKGTNYSNMEEGAQASWRNQNIGFVFQDHALLPHCTALENVLVPALVAARKADYESRARRLLDSVGLSERASHKPAQLSGGEKQRVAIARALICEPALLLCDEPTGNLDAAAAQSVADLLLALHGSTGVVVVTHSSELASKFKSSRTRGSTAG